MILGAWGLSDGSVVVSGESKQLLKVADEVWIATALLHRENPQAADFSVEEIARRAEREALAGELRASFLIHVAQHCVANRPPHPARHQMLFETGPGRRRLFRKGDPHHPARKNGQDHSRSARDALRLRSPARVVPRLERRAVQACRAQRSVARPPAPPETTTGSVGQALLPASFSIATQRTTIESERSQATMFRL